MRAQPHHPGPAVHTCSVGNAHNAWIATRPRRVQCFADGAHDTGTCTAAAASSLRMYCTRSWSVGSSRSADRRVTTCDGPHEQRSLHSVGKDASTDFATKLERSCGSQRSREPLCATVRAPIYRRTPFLPHTHAVFVHERVCTCSCRVSSIISRAFVRCTCARARSSVGCARTCLGSVPGLRIEP